MQDSTTNIAREITILTLNPGAPFTVGSPTKRIEYFHKLIDILGARYIILNLKAFREEGDLPAALKVLTEQGIEHEGLHYRVINANSSAKSSMLYAVDDETAAHFDGWFGVKDIIRLGVLFTPCVSIHMIAGGVQSVADDYPMCGDGSGLYRQSWGAKAGLYGVGQVRGCFDFGATGVVVKGTVAPADLPDGVDLVLPKSMVKGNLAELPEFFQTKFPLGVVRLAKAHVSEIGYQVAEKFPKAVDDAIAVDSPAAIKHLWEISRDPETFAEAVEIRDEDDEVAFTTILKSLSQLCKDIGNNKLLYMTGVTRQIEGVISKMALRIVLTGGMRGTGLMAQCDHLLPDGVIRTNPMSLVEGKYVGIRNPFVESRAAFAVECVNDVNTPEGCFFVNNKTCNRAALDFDGDEGNFVAVGSPTTEAWWNWLRANSETSPHKVRAEQAPTPQSRADALATMMSVNVGEPNNTLSDLVTAYRIGMNMRSCPELAKLRKMLVARDPKADIPTSLNGFVGLLTAILCKEIQKAVDSAKKFSAPDRDLVNAIREWARLFITKNDVAHRELSNGKVHPWTVCDMEHKEIAAKYKDTVFEAIKYGTVINPTHFVSDRTPLGKRFYQDMPVVNWTARPNNEFASWIKVRSGEGHDQAVAFYKQTVEALSQMYECQEDVDSRRHEIFQAWRNTWASVVGVWSREKLESAASGLWECFTKSENSKGSLFFAALPDICFDLIRQDYQPGKEPVVFSGIVYGRTIYPKDQVVTEAREVITRRGERTVKLQFLDEHRNALDKYAIIAQSDATPVIGTRYLVSFKPVKKADGTPSKRASFVAETFHELSTVSVEDDSRIEIPAGVAEHVAANHHSEDDAAYWASLGF